MPINWQDQEVKDRLLAAIIASFDGAINCKRVAQLYGEGATYNAIENFLRKPKKTAVALKAEAEASGRDGPAPSPARPRAKKDGAPKTPTKGDGVKTGRVTKKKASANSSPIKKEYIPDEDIFGDIDTGMDDDEDESI